MRFAYADPPYPGNIKRYDDYEYVAEVNHWELLHRLSTEYDGWLLHTGSVNLTYVLGICSELDITDFRIMAWVKPFAAFKRNVPVAYAWEPVLVKEIRKPVVTRRVEGLVSRDWFPHNITLKTGMVGVKPEKVCWWLFEVSGLEPKDQFDDLFPGTGAVMNAWDTWSQHVLQWRESLV